MKIMYRMGDLLTAEPAVICHGCNAQGVGNAGFFGELRKEIPVAYEAYRAAFDDRTHSFDIGDVIWAFDMLSNRRPRIIGNIITQEHYGRERGRCYVSYPAIERGLIRVADFVAQTQSGEMQIAAIGPIQEVGFPLIGTGLGGGSWSRIEQLIEQTSHGYQPIVYTLDGEIPSN